jgi:hypothetical protein
VTLNAVRRVLLPFAAALASLLIAAPALAAVGGREEPSAAPQVAREYVTNLNDSGPGSLRAALAAGPRYVYFDLDLRGQIKLTSSLTVGPGPTTVELPPDRDIRLSGDDAARLFVVPAGATLTLSGLTITHGRVVGRAVTKEDETGGPGEGGAIFNQGTLELDRVRLTDSAAIGGRASLGTGGSGEGGAIYNAGNLTIAESTIGGSTARGNGDHDLYVSPLLKGGSASGGAIYNAGSLEIVDSELREDAAIGADGFSLNFAWGTLGTGGGSGLGGAIFDAKGSSLQEAWSTFAGDHALGGSIGVGLRQEDPGGDAAGGAIFDASGRTELVGSTFATDGAVLGRTQLEGRPAVLGGGALELRAGGELRADTIVDDPGSADVATTGPVPTESSIVGSCSGAGLRSLGFDLDVSGTCKLTGATDLRNLDPRLGSLGDHGGPTRTIAPSATSPAIDAGRVKGEDRDQRGMIRRIRFSDRPLPPGGDGSDIGAYELERQPLPHFDLSPQKLSFGGIRVGTTSKFQEATLTNDGQVPVKVGALKLGGAVDEFSISSQDCADASLAVGASCHVRVRFTPEDVGTRAATLTLATDKLGPMVLPLSGIGLEDRADSASPVVPEEGLEP